MPFHDQASEDLSRDCATFPAYTDYLYGPDTRLECYHEQEFALPTPPHQPIRYTNSTPSRSQSFVPEQQEESLASLDVRDPADGYGVELLGPQFVQSLYIPDAKLRMLLNESRRRMQGLVSARLVTPTPSRRQPLRALPDPKSASASQQHVKRSLLMQSSSATDVDEDLTSLIRSENSILSSNHPSIARHSLLVGCQAHIDQNGLRAYTISTHEDGNGEQIPVLRPGDIIDSPRYAFMPADFRQQLNNMMGELWSSLLEPATREISVRRIYAYSRHVHQKQEEWKQSQLERIRMLRQIPEQPQHQLADYNQITPQHPTSSHSGPFQHIGSSSGLSTPAAQPLLPVPQQLQSLLGLYITPALRETIDRILPTAIEALMQVRSEDEADQIKGLEKMKAIQGKVPPEGQDYFQEMMMLNVPRFTQHVNQLAHQHVCQKPPTPQELATPPALVEYINGILPAAFDAFMLLLDKEDVAKQNAGIVGLKALQARVPTKGQEYFQASLNRMKDRVDMGLDPLGAIAYGR